MELLSCIPKKVVEIYGKNYTTYEMVRVYAFGDGEKTFYHVRVCLYGVDKLVYLKPQSLIADPVLRETAEHEAALAALDVIRSHVESVWQGDKMRVAVLSDKYSIHRVRRLTPPESLVLAYTYPNPDLSGSCNPRVVLGRVGQVSQEQIDAAIKTAMAHRREMSVQYNAALKAKRATFRQTLLKQSRDRDARIVQAFEAMEEA